MATLYIAEFSGQGSDGYARAIPIVTQPPNAEQTVAIGGSSTQCTNALQNNTTTIRLHTDAICSIEIGVNPTSTATKARMAANQTEYFTVPLNSGFKVAVITNT